MLRALSDVNRSHFERRSYAHVLSISHSLNEPQILPPNNSKLYIEDAVQSQLSPSHLGLSFTISFALFHISIRAYHHLHA